MMMMMMMMMSRKTFLAVLACSVGVSAASFRQSAASARDVESGTRKLFGAYESDATPTAAPSAAPTETPRCPGQTPDEIPGTFVDFEGITLLLPEFGFYNLTDGSGFQVGQGGANASFVSDVSEFGGIDVSPTNYTSGGVFASSSGDGFQASVRFPELMCKVSFGFAIDFSEPVEDAIEVEAGMFPEKDVVFTAPAAPGDFDRASGLVHVDNNGTGFDWFFVSPVFRGPGIIYTVIIDNVCAIPCE